jgi:hypothetical protein
MMLWNNRRRSYGRGHAALIFGLVLVALLGATAPSQAGLKIIRIPDGGTGGTPPSNLAGGGNLITIFNQAADYWEMAFADPNQDWTVEFRYRWDPLRGGDGGLSAQFTLESAGGDPRRIQSGLITFLNNGNTLWFADPSPATNSAYSFVEPRGGQAPFFPEPRDLYLNTGIVFEDPINPHAKDALDLLTIAIHEIGHGLGLAQSPPDFEAPPQIDITDAVSPRYAGATFIYEAGGNEHLDFPSVMSGRNRLGIRQFPAVKDILVIAQISQFNRPVLSPYMELIIRGLDLPPGNKQALLTKLQKSREHLEAGNSRAARNMLSAFIQQINANPGGRLNQDQIDGLVSMAELRMDAIDEAATAE